MINFWFSLFTAFSIFGLMTLNAQTLPANQKTYKFSNGQWFDGKSFRRTTFYSMGGVFTKRKPKQVDETVDLKNGFVIPPLGDAHCHHFDSSYNITEQNEMYLRDGVFYAKVLNNFRSGAMEVAGQVNRPTSVDVAYAHGGLTGNYSHPIDIYEALRLGYYSYEQQIANAAKIWRSRKQENNAYYIIETADDIERKWSQILAGRPDFIKVFLRYGERWEQGRMFVPTVWGRDDGGVDPKLLPEIVKRAHTAGLRVTTAVSTAYDFHAATTAGVDEVGHLPEYAGTAKGADTKQFEITEQDAELAGKRKMFATMVVGDLGADGDERNLTVNNRNVELLKSKGVKFSFGSSSYGETPVKGVFAFSKYKIFSNLELLKTWCENTAQTIFPNRKIGRLRENYEASFLVLKGNPLEDFTQVKNIQTRFKQGVFIKIDRKP